jgi:hypothetical protein
MLTALSFLIYKSKNNHSIVAKQQCIKSLALTDFCISTANPYLRHLNHQTPMTIFQDLPAYHAHQKTDYIFLKSPFF